MFSRLPIVAGPSTAPENIDAHFIGATAAFVSLHFGSSARARLVCRLTKNASSCGPPSSSSGYGSGMKVASVPARGCQALVLCPWCGAGAVLLCVLAPPVGERYLSRTFPAAGARPRVLMGAGWRLLKLRAVASCSAPVCFVGCYLTRLLLYRLL